MVSTGAVKPPRNLRAVIEYDGRGYVGWETQKNGLAIQQVIEDAIYRITRERTTVNGSSRTDAGVHALGQTASFTLRHLIPTVDLHRALNAVMPADVVISTLEDVPLTFHARFSATGKVYRYDVWNDPIRPVLLRDRTFHVRGPLNLDAMREAASYLIGRHDFTSFTREAAALTSCVRTLRRIDISTDGARISLRFEGEGFLYNMVRILSGTLLEVGASKLTPADVGRIRDARNRNFAGPTLPSCALFLERVLYEGAPGDESRRLRLLLECLESSAPDTRA